MAKKRKSKKPYDEIMDVAIFGAKTTIAVGAIGSIANALKK